MPTGKAAEALAQVINSLKSASPIDPVTRKLHSQARRAMSMLFHSGQGLAQDLQEKVGNVIEKLEENRYTNTQELLDDLEGLRG